MAQGSVRTPPAGACKGEKFRPSGASPRGRDAESGSASGAVPPARPSRGAGRAGRIPRRDRSREQPLRSLEELEGRGSDDAELREMTEQYEETRECVALAGGPFRLARVPVAPLLADRRFQYRETCDREELFASICEEGQRVPVIARRSGEAGGAERYELISGFGRVECLARLGEQEVWALLFERADLPDEVAYRVAWVDNTVRRALGPLDRANYAWKLRADLGYEHREVARRMGLRKVNLVFDLFALAQAPAEIRGPLQRGEFSQGHASLLVRAWHKTPAGSAAQAEASGRSRRERRPTLSAETFGVLLEAARGGAPVSGLKRRVREAEGAAAGPLRVNGSGFTLERIAFDGTAPPAESAALLSALIRAASFVARARGNERVARLLAALDGE